MKTISINDAIHGTITLSSREAEIVDHPYVQRLRYIRQLGFVSLVYPCATHDRFSHALGTLHVAGLFCDQLLMNEEYSVLTRILSSNEKEFLRHIIRMSGLLHDVGHGPFSHTAENAMPLASELAIPAEWIARPSNTRRARHEDYSVLLLARMSEGTGSVITREEAAIVASLVDHKHIRIPDSWHTHFSRTINSQRLHGVIKTIISSDIDADRMDYLLRDAHFAGVSYGHFDLPWLISNLGTIAVRDGHGISISESGIASLEHYLLARANMYGQVYMHKTVKCFDYYFHRAVEEKEIDYQIPTDAAAYVSMRDSTLVEMLFEATTRDPRSWSARLVNRLPARRVCRVGGNEEHAQLLFNAMRRELRPLNVHPFLHITKSKFLDVPESLAENELSQGSSSLFSGLAAIPITVVRTQFGVKSAAPLSDYASILKYYHQDVMAADIYVPADEYAACEPAIRTVVKKFHTYAPTESIIEENEIGVQ